MIDGTYDTLKGKRALITGGTDGIGKQTALMLAQHGVEVVIVGRNPQKGANAVAEIQANAVGSNVTFWQYDLALMRSVEALAEAIRREPTKFDFIVYAAGAMLPRRVLTSENLETVFAVQYLARFHLTRLLLDDLSADHHIVSVSAAGTIPLRLDFDNLNGTKFYNGLYALVHESVANDLFALRLVRMHPEIRFYNYGPFYVKSGLFKEMPWWFRLMTSTMGPFVATTPEVAANDILTLLSTNHESGMYSRRLNRIAANKYRSDTAIQDRLWAISEQMIRAALATTPA